MIPDGLRIRPAVRALVLDHDNAVLLVRLVFPQGAWWVLPGGGIEEDETLHGALHRELAEEVGLHDAVIGAHVWSRTHVFPMNDRWDGQREDVFLVRTHRFDPAPALDTESLRAENLHDIGWHLDDLAAYEGTDHFAPADLHARVVRIVAHGAPEIPDVIVQVEPATD
jgi:8-oxo-dGTP pyrophosphatase MutT (NUDIX family)